MTQITWTEMIHKRLGVLISVAVALPVRGWLLPGVVTSPLVPAARVEWGGRGSRSSRHPSSPRLAAVPADVVASSSERGAISLTVAELAKYLGGTGRAKLVWDCYKVGIDPQDWFGPSAEAERPPPDLGGPRSPLSSSRRGLVLGPGALRALAGSYGPARCVEGGVAALAHVATSADGTTKLLLRLRDGLLVETVIIPVDGRSTLCISSQVGCRQGCTFCATGRMGKLRSLSSDEILVQMFYGRKICRIHSLPEITNVVFMGMGEPSDNADAVLRATRILTTRECFQLSARRVTVSTVAPSPEAFTKFRDAPCVLAWSVHAARDELRRRLVPTTTHTMVELRRGMIEALAARPVPLRTTMLEVTLIDGVNDGRREAEELAEFAKVIAEAVAGCKVVVNLIPFNDIGHPQYRRPTQETILAFQQCLWDAGLRAHIRTTRGDDESAACGQLSTRRGQPQSHSP